MLHVARNVTRHKPKKTNVHSLPGSVMTRIVSESCARRFSRRHHGAVSSTPIAMVTFGHGHTAICVAIKKENPADVTAGFLSVSAKTGSRPGLATKETSG